MTDRDRLIKLIDGFVFGTQIIVNNIEWDSTKVKELADYLIDMVPEPTRVKELYQEFYEYIGQNIMLWWY